jgi:hypothetical protein
MNTLPQNELVRRKQLNARLSSPIGQIQRCSATKDDEYYGSEFIGKWERIFTDKNGRITFNSIYEPLVAGLTKEGEIDLNNEDDVAKVISVLNEIKTETVRKRNKRRMEALQYCCVVIYTMDSYVYRVTNNALRENDQTKLLTIGPFCYLLFNYINERHNDSSSIKCRFKRALRSWQGKFLTVHRGDVITDELIEDFRNAIGDDSIYFKWQSFVSTSHNEKVAEKFEHNVFYVIELDHHSARDQCIDLTDISIHEDEKELLLRPGVRFKVTKVESDRQSKQHKVYIRILPSPLSLLR